MLLDKDILSELIEQEVEEVVEIKGWFLYYKRPNNKWNQGEPIYNLAHKCKEWAYEKYGISLSSFKGEKAWICADEYELRISGIDIEHDQESMDIDFAYGVADGEAEAIFAACNKLKYKKDEITAEVDEAIRNMSVLDLVEIKNAFDKILEK